MKLNLGYQLESVEELVPFRLRGELIGLNLVGGSRD